MKYVPLGLRHYLPHEVDSRDRLINQMKAVVEVNGYQRIITPSIEHFECLQPALGQQLCDKCIMFFDGSGAQLVLRPDHTIPIARVVSLRLCDQLPVKLYYYDPVFRKDPLLGETEIVQFGCEYIGTLSVVDEAKIIRMVMDVCLAVGLDDIEIYVSHPELFDHVSQDKLMQIKQGNWTMCSELPAKGGADIVPDNKYFNAFYHELSAMNISDSVFVHQGLYKDLTYYNGLFFDVISKKFGKVIGSGGRYDTVLQAFGVNANAFGFALRLHYLEKAIDAK